MDLILLRRLDKRFRLGCVLVCLVAYLATPRLALASEYRGQVVFGGLSVPGATITATQGTQRVVAISDQLGSYSFADLVDGTWKIEVEMQCFSTLEETVTIAPNMAAAKWELKLLSLDQIVAKLKRSSSIPSHCSVRAALPPPARARRLSRRTATLPRHRSRRRIPSSNPPMVFSSTVA